MWGDHTHLSKRRGASRLRRWRLTVREWTSLVADLVTYAPMRGVASHSGGILHAHTHARAHMSVNTNRGTVNGPPHAPRLHATACDCMWVGRWAGRRRAR